MIEHDFNKIRNSLKIGDMLFLHDNKIIYKFLGFRKCKHPCKKYYNICKRTCDFKDMENNNLYKGICGKMLSFEKMDEFISEEDFSI